MNGAQGNGVAVVEGPLRPSPPSQPPPMPPPHIDRPLAKLSADAERPPATSVEAAVAARAALRATQAEMALADAASVVALARERIRAATAKAAAEEAAAKEAAAEKAKEDEEFSLDVLRMALRRTSQQAYRLELHACALTSAAAARWSVLPQPEATTEDAQQESVRRQLRTLAVMCACFAPFTAWASLLRERHAERIASMRNEAIVSARLKRLRSTAMAEIIDRIRKQDATLRKLSQRKAARAALQRWAHEAVHHVDDRLGFFLLRRLWLHRWHAAATTMREYGPKKMAAVHGAMCYRSFRAFERNREFSRWFGAWRGTEGLARGMGALRRRRHATHRLRGASALTRLRVRLGRLRRAMRAWTIGMHAEARAGRQLHQDAALRALLTLWATTAKDAVECLAAPPPLSEEEAALRGEIATLRALAALGGHWEGTREELEIAVGLTCGLKVKLLEERREVSEAARIALGASLRVEELFGILHQQRANLTALVQTVERSEAEALCLDRSLQGRSGGRSRTSSPYESDEDELWGVQPARREQASSGGSESKLAQVVADADARMRARMLRIEARCCQEESRLDALQRRVQRARILLALHPPRPPGAPAAARTPAKTISWLEIISTPTPMSRARVGAGAGGLFASGYGAAASYGLGSAGSADGATPRGFHA